MRVSRLGVLIAGGLLLAATGTARAGEPERYGRIIIEGNTETPANIILGLVNIRPGQRIDQAVLRAAEQRLGDCWLFPSNPWRGTGPTIEVLENEIESNFKDVLIRVTERRGNYLLTEITDLMVELPLALFIDPPADPEVLFGWIERLNERLLKLAVYLAIGGRIERQTDE